MNDTHIMAAIDPALSEQLFLALLALVTAAVTYVLVPAIRIYGEKLAAKVEAETTDAKYAAATRHLKDLVADAVLEVEQTYVRRMKAHGKWDAEAARIARDTAVNVARRHLGEGVSIVMDALGITDAGVIMGKLRTMTEAEVARHREATTRPLSPEDTFVPMVGMEDIVDDETV